MPKSKDPVAGLLKWAHRSQMENTMKACINLARSEPGIAETPESFDRDLWRINLQNGVLNLESGELEPHRRELYMTQMANVAYDPKATCPRFLAFLDRNSGGRQDLVAYKQRLYGSTLAGSIRDQKFYILNGAGANGKSVELSVLRTFLGDYACQTASDTILKRKSGAATNDLARLRGKRMVVANETENGDKLAAALIKQMTGGEPIAARFHYQEFKEIQPQWKLFIGTNHLPDIDGADAALARRINVIPYDVVIPEHERDPDLKEKLLEEASGILNWMLEGCLAWQKIGLAEPACVHQVVEAYRADCDPIGSWIEECCELGDYRSAAVELYTRFDIWCSTNGHDHHSLKRFGTILGQKGFKAVKSGTTFRTGLRLKPKVLH